MIEEHYRQYAPPLYEDMVLGQISEIDCIRNVLLKIIRDQTRCSKIADLPESQGVYFVCQKGKLIYIGKSVNLKDRWQKHFLKNEPGIHVLWKEPDTRNFVSLEHEEGMYILLLRPIYNNRVTATVYPEWWKSDGNVERS